MNNHDVPVCYQCGAAFALESEAVVAPGCDDFALDEAPVAMTERLRTPELFAQSLRTLAELEREILRAPAPGSDAALALPVAAEPSVDSSRRADGGRWHRIAAGLALVLAIEALAYFAHRPHTAMDDWLAGVQLEILALARASESGERETATPADKSAVAASAATPSNGASNETVMETESALGVQAPVSQEDASSDASEAAPTLAEQNSASRAPTDTPEQPAVGDAAPAARSDEPAQHAQSDEPAQHAQSDGPAQRVQSDEPVQRVQSDQPVKRAQFDAPRKRTPSTVASPQRKPPAVRSYEPPQPLRLPATAPSPVDRPCTQAVAALGLCEP